MENFSLKRSHEGKKHTFFLGFLRNLFDFFLELKLIFWSINIYSLKALNFGFYFIFIFLHYIICIICIIFLV
jgi:hypothetical protein